MSLSKIAKRLLNPKIHILHKAGYLNDELKITDSGRLALDHIIFEKFEEELVAAAQDKIAREDAENK